MGVWWEALSTLGRIFAAAAIPATVILILQTVMLLFGLGLGGGDSADDVDVDGDTGDADTGGDYAFESDTAQGESVEAIAGLRLFTVRGIISFFAIGGWCGVFLKDVGAPDIWAILGAVIAGCFATWLMALFMKMAMKLQSSGNILLENARGKEAMVYLTIPGNMERTGKITMELQGRFVEIDAFTKRSEQIRTGQRVKVVDVINGTTVLVEELSL